MARAESSQVMVNEGQASTVSVRRIDKRAVKGKDILVESLITRSTGIIHHFFGRSS